MMLSGVEIYCYFLFLKKTTDENHLEAMMSNARAFGAR
jgi:hypothetical protein